VPLFATQAGAPGANTMPQGLTSSSSVVAAVTDPSEISALIENALASSTVSVTDLLLLRP
jgi:hypothetical protein